VSTIAVRLNVNGTAHDVLVEPRKLLTDVLRDDCGLTGTHVGCEHGVCGACTVLVDGQPARACLAFGVQMAGRRIETVESLAVDGAYHALQKAFHEHHALQCGFCTAGILMTFVAYLKRNPDPSEDEVRDVLGGNLCRCTGYHNIVIAILDAARVMREAAR
jgi:aerobic carbon-monoxide dehydrogenase small subunit